MEDYNNQFRDHSSPRTSFLYGNQVSAASTYGINSNRSDATTGGSSSSFKLQYLQSDHQNSGAIKSELAATTSTFLGQKFHHNPSETKRDHDPLNTEDVASIKDKIMSHPQCSSLLQAYMDCQKVYNPFSIFLYKKIRRK